MTKQGRLWIAAGVALDVGAVVLIARSLPQTGLPLAAGVGLLIAGSLVVFQGSLRLAKEARGLAGPTRTPASRSDWTLEPELQTAPPRPVHLTRAGRQSAGLWIAMIVVVVAYVFLAPRPSRTPPLLDEAGVTVTAAVHRKDERKTASGETAYYVYYNFETKEGSQVRASKRASKQVYDSLAVGDSIEVIYFPYDPQQHFAPRLEQGTMPLAIRWGALGLLGALLFLFEQQRRFHRKIVAEGKAVEGVVEAVRRRGNNRVFTVRFKLQGQERTLRGSERNPERADGDVVTVLYLPERLERALLYCTSLYRAGTS